MSHVFEVSFDRSERLLEVVYPSEPAVADIEAYVTRVREVMESLEGAWVCLVDQREMAVLPPELMKHVASLNALGHALGMKRAARLVTSAVAGLQAGRIGRDTGAPVRSFSSRTDALRWLRQGLRE